jgi:hypothetical protein
VTNSPKDKEQARRFRDAAREIGADETGKAFEAAFGKIVPPKRPGDKVEPKGKPGG